MTVTQVASQLQLQTSPARVVVVALLALTDLSLDRRLLHLHPALEKSVSSLSATQHPALHNPAAVAAAMAAVAEWAVAAALVVVALTVAAEMVLAGVAALPGMALVPALTAFLALLPCRQVIVLSS